MKRATSYMPPTTYSEIVAAANRQHEQRIAELKRAAKHITAVERDLTKLAESRIYVDIDRYSMHLVDCRKIGDYVGRAQWGLRILPSMSLGDAPDRLVAGFLSLGWAVERIDLDGHCTKVVLRRPKTQLRLRLDCSLAYASSLELQEVA